jgi:hypothetical protein
MYAKYPLFIIGIEAQRHRLRDCSRGVSAIPRIVI